MIRYVRSTLVENLPGKSNADASSRRSCQASKPEPNLSMVVFRLAASGAMARRPSTDRQLHTVGHDDWATKHHSSSKHKLVRKSTTSDSGVCEINAHLTKPAFGFHQAPGPRNSMLAGRWWLNWCAKWAFISQAQSPQK